MTVATTMTPDQFLASNPMDHPDFVPCDLATDRPLRSLLMPNLVALIQRIGGLDAIPDRMSAPPPDFSHVDVAIALDGIWYEALLRDRKSHRVYAELSRLGENLEVSGWHPHDSNLTIAFNLVADWAAGAWTITLAQIDDG